MNSTSVLDDLRHAARNFRRSPLFTVMIVATLAIGIGAATAVFSVVDRLLFRSLPYSNPDRLVSFGLTGPIDENEFMLGQGYERWLPHLAPFDSATSLSPWVEGDLGDENPVRVRCIPVEANFLSTFGLRVAVGRDFTRLDDQPNAPRVALLSFALWRSRFAENSALLNRIVTLDDQPTRIIGVLPKDFELPTLGRADVLIPQQLDVIAQLHGGSMRFLRAFARLKPGVSIAQAGQQLQPLFQTTLQTEVPPPLRPEVHLTLRTLRDRQVSDVRLASWLLSGAVLALLSIACANAANLLLARSAARQREWAMRAALGASRARLIRQALTESILFAFAGALVGSFLAGLLLKALVALAPEGLLHLRQATIDIRVLAFTAFISVCAAILFGLAPALEVPRPEYLTGWRAVGGERPFVRNLLVSLQIAVSLVLLTGASLFARSLLALQNQSLGLQPARTITASFELGHRAYQTPQKLTSFYNQLAEKLASIPGVTALALSDSVPPAGWVHSRPLLTMSLPGGPPLTSAGGTVFFRYVSTDYFRILRIPILHGRRFNDADRFNAQNSVVLSSTLARRLFGQANPLGRQVLLNPQNPSLTVVGVAAEVKNNGLENTPEPEYYQARKRTLDPGLGSRGVVLIESAVPTPILAPYIRSAIASLDPRLAVTVETLRQHVNEQADRPRFLTVLISLFATLGLVLAAVGLYGVMTFLVNRQTREIGVRIAIGATPANIVGLILKHAAVWTAGGMAVGLCASLALTRLARGLLFHVSPDDPLSLLIATAVLASAAFLAALVPSRRASRVDPAVLLRSE